MEGKRARHSSVLSRLYVPHYDNSGSCKGLSVEKKDYKIQHILDCIFYLYNHIVFIYYMQIICNYIILIYLHYSLNRLAF